MINVNFILTNSLILKNMQKDSFEQKTRPLVYGFDCSFWRNNSWTRVHVFLDPESHSLINIYEKSSLQ